MVLAFVSHARVLKTLKNLWVFTVCAYVSHARVLKPLNTNGFPSFWYMDAMPGPQKHCRTIVFHRFPIWMYYVFIDKIIGQINVDDNTVRVLCWGNFVTFFF